MKNLFMLSKKDDTVFKQIAIKKEMIKYYKTINQGKFSLPAQVLAVLAMKLVKADERIDELYEKLAG